MKVRDNFRFSIPTREIQKIWGSLSKDMGVEFRNTNLIYKHDQWKIILDIHLIDNGDFLTHRTHTRMRAPFVAKDALKLKIYPKNMFHKMSKIIGLQDINIGDKYFDKKFIIKGNNEEKIKLLLLDDKVKTLINSYPEICLEIRDNDDYYGSNSRPFPKGIDELYCTCFGFIKEERQARGLFDLGSLLLEKLVEIDIASRDYPGNLVDYWK